MDSTALHLVLAWMARWPGLSVVPGPPRVQRLFALTRTDALLRRIERPEVDAA